MLWQHLVHPPRHPLYLRMLRIPTISILFTSHVGWLLPVIGGTTCCGLWSLLFHTETTVPVFLLVATLLVSTAYVSLWAIDTSVSLARARERNTYDPVCMAPSGPLGVHWALCAASLHRQETLMWIDLLRKIAAGMLLLMFVGVVITTASREKAADPTAVFALLLDMVSLAVTSYLEHVQATVLGCLMGMYVPLYCPSPAAARIWPVLGFVGLQCGAVLATLPIVALIAPLLPPVISPLVFGLLAFFLIREGIVTAVWRSLARRLNTDPARLDLDVG
jgi:hypothetical protein